MDYQEVLDNQFGGTKGASFILKNLNDKMMSYNNSGRKTWERIIGQYFKDNQATSFEELIEKNPESFFTLARQISGLLPK